MIIKVQKNDFNLNSELKLLKSNCEEYPGAISSFIGYVRRDKNQNSISSMTLEHYPGMTEKKLSDILKHANEKWPLLGTLIVHRYGKLKIGDQIVLVASASLHRKAAFESSEFIMDFLKTNAPFWKSEAIDKRTKWVGENEEDQKALMKWSV